MEKEKQKLDGVKSKIQRLTDIHALIYKSVDDTNKASELYNLIDTLFYEEQGTPYFDDEQIKLIQKSFQPLSEEDKGKWWLGHCENCGWWGSTELCGGGQLGLSGDYDGPYCPICGSDEIIDVSDEEDNYDMKELYDMLGELCDACGRWDNGLWRGKDVDPQTVIKARKVMDNFKIIFEGE